MRKIKISIIQDLAEAYPPRHKAADSERGYFEKSIAREIQQMTNRGMVRVNTSSAKRLELGEFVEDKITGLKGTIIGIARWIGNEPESALVLPKIGRDGELKKSTWFYLDRLKRCAKR